MTELIPDNRKKYRQFIWTSAMNLPLLIILALSARSLTQQGIALLPSAGDSSITAPAQWMYVLAPLGFGVVGVLLALAWKPLRRGIIVLLAMHYILMMSIILLLGYVDVTLLLTKLRALLSNPFILPGFLAVLVFLFLQNIKSIMNLDLPSVFGKR